MTSLNHRQVRRFSLGGLVVLALLMALLWQQLQIPPTMNPVATPMEEVQSMQEPIATIPTSVQLQANKVILGEKLFQDVRLSRTSTLSCASCHTLKTGGTDRQPYSVGASGTPYAVNTLTVFNAAANIRFGWDGRYETVEEMIEAQMYNPDAMGSSWQQAIDRLQQDPQYRQTFTQIYGDGLTPANVIDALATFQRSLYTPNARFDQFLRGNQHILTPLEREGYTLFKTLGCVACHQGMNVGGNMFQKLGVVRDYFADRGSITKADYGRFNITGEEVDRFVFRVPSLRNIAITAPYFHDGSAKTLEEAIATMARYQLGRTLEPEQISSIAQFLRTLTGRYQNQPL